MGEVRTGFLGTYLSLLGIFKMFKRNFTKKFLKGPKRKKKSNLNVKKVHIKFACPKIPIGNWTFNNFNTPS